MSKSFRIRTTPGGDDEYIKVDIDLKQKFDFLEILSLKISQAEEYGNFCAEYGVIAGRVIVNNGFGVPNVKISIFIPVEEADLDNEIIKEFYPYTTPNPNEKNGRGIRYNVLPDQQNTLDHTPVGTFREKRDTLDNSISLEIYEKYYKYTTTTNAAGDYILFGVPVGEHILHYDMDISDMGFLSYRPYELIAQGYNEKLFTNRFKFKSSNNINSLTQIISENLPITVEPYWCDSLSLGSTLGINRRDISIDQIEIIPSAIFFGSIFSDDEKDSVNKNCRPDKDMGEMKEVITGEGKLEAIRRNFDGGIETYDIDGDAIDENGNWSIIVPMNLRKVITDEFGELVPSPDGIKGVASEADLRFKVSMDKSDTDKRLRERAKFIVPNLTGNYNFGTYSQATLKVSDDFKINRQLSEATQNTSYSADTTNQYNYLEDFFTFRWKKVYTVKQYIGRYQKTKNDEGRSFIGIKDILRGEGVNKFPTNRTDTSVHVLYTIICTLLTFFALLVALINGIIMVINGLITMICQFKFPVGISIRLTYCLRILKGFCNSKYRSNGISPCRCEKAKNGCKCCSKNNICTKDNEFKIKLLLKWKCLFGGALCKKCKDYCTGKHSCCIQMFNKDALATSGNPPRVPKSYEDQCPVNDKMLREADEGPPPNSTHPCCCRCCIKIPLIALHCHEEGATYKPSIIKSPFASGICNETFVVPFCCTQNCGGPQTALIKDWVSCVMEPIAVWLKMLKFDFYNDWANGSLYFPLIKRKYKVKKSNKRSGQIKKDKFCDFHCIIRDWGTPTLIGTLIPGPNIDGIQFPGYPPLFVPWRDTTNFQGPAFYYVNRVKIRRKLFTKPIVVDQRIGSPTFGCRAQFRSSLTTNWVGTLFSNETENLNIAASTVVLKGNDNEGNGCQITFKGGAAYQELKDMIDTNPDLKINFKERWWIEQVSTKHGKPDYVKTDDPLSGVKTWVNIGGHGHHKNICNNARLIERGEYFKPELDCLIDELIDASSAPMTAPDTSESSDGTAASSLCTSGTDCLIKCPGQDSCSLSVCCKAACGANGVKACNIFCNCRETIPNINEYIKNIYHGMVVMGEKDSDLYYAVSMKPQDPYFNETEYKANLFYPVGITELGSSTYCDIDEAPFIMDQLVPTTFNVSMEGLKYRLDTQVINDNPNPSVDPYVSNIPIKKIEDKDGTLNLRAYVEFSCIATVCLNVMGTVNHSQIGVEMIDKNDMGIEIGNCWTRFIHDVDIREYFCRRFSSYKNGALDVWYQKPGSSKFENSYGPYSEIRLHEGYELTYQLPSEDDISSGIKVPSEYNDNEYFVPGDACGYIRSNDTTPSAVNNPIYPAGTDYFYGLAPGVTNSLIDFPGNPSNINLPDDPGHTHYLYGTTTDVIHFIDDVDIFVQDDEYSGSDYIYAIRFNRSQTPYFFYFGLVPGKTSLHKTVGKFFADKINAVTLQGIKPGEPIENQYNKPNIQNPVKNLYSIYKTCLGEVELPIAAAGYTPSGQTVTYESIVKCELSLTETSTDESQQGAGDGQITITATANPIYPPLSWTWSAINNPTNAPGDGASPSTDSGVDSASGNDLLPDIYIISVVDFEGCSASITVPIGIGAPTCCQTVGLIKATVTDPSLASEAKFCWSPCQDIGQDPTLDPPTTFLGTNPKCGPYADIPFDDPGHIKCKPDSNPTINIHMNTTTASYASSGRCASYPNFVLEDPPNTPNEYPLEFYLCSCDEIRRPDGTIWGNTLGDTHKGITFTTLDGAAFCENIETRLPESISGDDGPCVLVEGSDIPESYTSIDDILDMGIIEDQNGDPIITKAAKVMRLKVTVPLTGVPYPGGECPCPATVYFRVYGGTMNLDPVDQTPQAQTDWNLISTAPNVFNSGLPCVRAMVRVMKPSYDVKNYNTDRTDHSYSNILVQTGFVSSTKQKAIDYSQQEWYDGSDNPWDGQPVGYEPDTFLDVLGQYNPFGISGLTITANFGKFSGATPPEIATYGKFSRSGGDIPAGPFVDIAPNPCNTTVGFACRSFKINSGGFLDGFLTPNSIDSNTGLPFVQTYWMPWTTIPDGGNWWLSDEATWGQYKPHENPNNPGFQAILDTGDYVVNVRDNTFSVWQGWNPPPYSSQQTDTTNCSSSFIGWCCNTTLTKMLWTPDITDITTNEYRLNPVGEGVMTNYTIGDPTNPTQDLNNSLLYEGSTTPSISAVDHPWLHVNSKYSTDWSGNFWLESDGITGELDIKLYKPGTYIFEISLFQYENGEYKDGGGYGSQDCYAELYSKLG